MCVTECLQLSDKCIRIVKLLYLLQVSLMNHFMFVLIIGIHQGSRLCKAVLGLGNKPAERVEFRSNEEVLEDVNPFHFLH